MKQFFDIPEYTFDFCPSYLTDVPLAGYNGSMLLTTIVTIVGDGQMSYML